MDKRSIPSFLKTLLFLTGFSCLPFVITSAGALAGAISSREISTPSDALTATMSNGLWNISCGRAEDLAEALAADIGGTIRISNDIEWNEALSMPIAVTRPVRVEMENFRIVIPEDTTFIIQGPVTFTGDGGQEVMLDVWGDFGATQEVTLQVTGDYKTALHYHGDSWNSNAGQFTIQAEGTGCVALRLSGSDESDLIGMNILARGTGSVGISAEGPLRIMLSTVKASGTAILSSSGEITIDASRVSPIPDGALVIPRYAVPNNRLEENGICIAAGSARQELFEILEDIDVLTYMFLSEKTNDSYLYMVKACWTNLPDDLSVPGEYSARCVPTDIPSWLPIKPESLKVPVKVVEKEKPFLMDVQDAGDSLYLRFFSEISQTSGLKLFYSADNGVTWQDAMDLKKSFLTASGAGVGPIDPNKDYLFQMAVTEGPMQGVSNRLLFKGLESKNNNGGGDRDYDDRDDQGEIPPSGIIIPPPAGDSPGRDAIAGPLTRDCNDRMETGLQTDDANAARPGQHTDGMNLTDSGQHTNKSSLANSGSLFDNSNLADSRKHMDSADHANGGDNSDQGNNGKGSVSAFSVTATDTRTGPAPGHEEPENNDSHRKSVWFFPAIAVIFAGGLIHGYRIYKKAVRETGKRS